MSRYRVQITETLQKIVEVDMVDADAAIEKVKSLYETEEIILMSEAFVDVDFDIVD